MNISELIGLERGPRSELIQWLQTRYLLPNPLNCAQCNHAMELTERNGNHVGGFLWRCSGCQKRRSLRTNSFFSEFPKVPLTKLLMAIYHYSNDDSQRRTAEVLGLNRSMVSKIFRGLQDVCSLDLQRRPIIPFGGPGSVVKCDESKFNHKAKYHRGRRAAHDSWVFGIVSCDYSPAKGYFEVVQRRDAATLLPIIQRCVRPGTEVYSDDWGAYRRLQQLPNVLAHQVVVHAHNFVDPHTGVHTQEVESAWSQLKLPQKQRKGIRRGDLQSYLDERMWRQWRGGNHPHRMRNYLAILPLHFPTDTPA
ncbi:male abnormal protein mab-31-like [Oculina patagonica]